MRVLPVDKLSKRIAGSVPVPEDDFEARLGRVAFATWARLRALRADDGTTEATLADIAAVPGFEPLSERYVRKGLARLRELGIVVQERGAGGRGKRRRRVYGAVGEAREGRVVMVTGKVWRALRDAAKWGGKRAQSRGAVNGKARGAVNTSSAPLDLPDRTLGSEWRGAPTPKKQGSKARGAMNGQEGPKTTRERARGAMNAKPNARPRKSRGAMNAEIEIPPSGESTRTRAGAGARVLVNSLDHQISSRPVRFPSETECADVTSSRRGGSLSEVEMAEASHEVVAQLATSLGRFKPTRLHPRLLPGVPRFPGFDVVMPAVTPEPPLLSPDDPDKHHVRFLAATWASVYEHRVGRKDWTFRGRGAASKRAKYRKLLLAARDAFIEHEIAPAPWLAFSFDVWAAKTHDAKPPPIRWAYDADRIENRRGWFRREGASQYRGGLAMTTPSLRKLRKRYAAMSAALLTLDGNPPDDEQVRAVLDRYFPGDLYDVLVETARSEAVEQQERLRHRAIAGDWLDWSGGL